MNLWLIFVTIGCINAFEPDKFYEGCFEDEESHHDLTFLILKSYQKLTTDICINACRNAKFNFAGTQNGVDCYCGNRQVRIYEESGGCGTPCSGNPGEVCGGPGVNSVYRVPWDSRYLGCYGSEGNSTGELQQRLWDENGNQNALNCVRACGLEGFIYAAVRNGGACDCGNSYAATIPRNETECDLRCGTGWGRQNCGGDNISAIYRADTVYSMDQATQTSAVKIKELADSETIVSLALFSINPSLKTILTKKVVIDTVETLTPSEDPACSANCYEPCGNVYYEPGMKYSNATVIVRSFFLDLAQIVSMVPETASRVHVYAQTVLINKNIVLPFAIQIKTRQLLIDHSKAQIIRVNSDASLGINVEEEVKTDVMPDPIFEKLSFMCAKILAQEGGEYSVRSWHILNHMASYSSYQQTTGDGENVNRKTSISTFVRSYITEAAGVGIQNIHFIPFYTKIHISNILEKYADKIAVYSSYLNQLIAADLATNAILDLSEDIHTIYLETDLYEAEIALSSSLDAVTTANATYERMSLYYDLSLEVVDEASVRFDEGIAKAQEDTWITFLTGFVVGMTQIVTGSVRVAVGDMTGITSISDGSMGIVDAALSVSHMVEQIEHLTKVADDLMEKLEEANDVAELNPFMDDLELTVQLRTGIVDWMNLANYATTVLDDDNVMTIDGCKEYKKALLDLCNWGEEMTRTMVERAELLRIATEKKTMLLIKQQQIEEVQELFDSYEQTLAANEALINAIVEQTYDVRIDLNDALLTFCQAYFYENMKECKSTYKPSFGSSLDDLLIKINAAKRDSLLVDSAPSSVLRDVYITDEVNTEDCEDFKVCPIRYFKQNGILPFEIPSNFSGLSDIKAFKISEVEVELSGVKAGLASGNTIMKIKVESCGAFKGVNDGQVFNFMTRPLSVTFEQDIESGHISMRANIYEPLRSIIQHVTPYTTWLLRLSTLTTRDLDISEVTYARLRLIGSALNAEF